MVDFHDRRDSVGSGDFNNPKGTFSITTHGDAEYDAWKGKPLHDMAKRDVHAYYRGQKDTQTWAEANRLAQKRSAYAAQHDPGITDIADYADVYHDNLARVMATKGPALADQFGELKHRQSGYGRV